MAEFRLNEHQWEKVYEEILDQERGRPRTRDKECMEAIIYVLKTGCQWSMLPSCYPPKSTVHRRFMLWRKQGVFRRLFKATRDKTFGTVAHIDATVKVAKRGIADKPRWEIQIHENYSPV